MKKFYVLVSLISFGTVINAQISNPTKSAHALRLKTDKTPVSKPTNVYTPKAEGDVLYSNGFGVGDPAWTITSAAGTTGTWQIVAALPTTLSSQAAGYGFPTSIIGSPAPFALINSDGAGQGVTQNASIELSTAIDLTARGVNPIAVTFKEIYRHYQEDNFVAYSNNNGVTWVEFPVNAAPEVPVNTNSANPESQSLFMFAPAGGWSAQVKFRFRYEGAYDWFWAIDDFKVIEPFNNDLKTIRIDAFADTVGGNNLPYDYYTVGAGQQSNFPGHTFQGYLKNEGAAAQTTPRLTASSAAISYSAVSGAGLIYPLGLPTQEVDTFNISTVFNPAANGTYNVLFNSTMTPNTDSDLLDNELALNGFVEGGNDFGRDKGVRLSGVQRFAGTGNETIGFGNQMDIYTTTLFKSAKIYLPLANTQQAAYVGDDLGVRIDTFDFNLGAWTPEAFVSNIIAHTPTDARNGTWVNLGFPDYPNGITLTAGSAIRIFYLRNETGESTFTTPTSQETTGGVLGVLSGNGTYTGLADPNAVMVRLSTDLPAPVSGVGLNEVQPISDLAVYPNPAKESATINALIAGESAVITVTDLTGKVVYTAKVNVVNGELNHSVTTSNFADGTYLVVLTSNGASSTRKLAVKN